jgi:50S ribosomal protein uL14
MPRRTRPLSAKGVMDYNPHVARGLPVNAKLNCADNTGAKKLKIISVIGYKGRLNRMPAAHVGEMVLVSVSKGRPDLRKQILPAVIIRQRKSYKRTDGVSVEFEDNAAVIMTPEGELKGSEIKGPVAKEAATRWPRIASASSTIV